MTMLFEIPMRLGLGGNDREHWRERDRRVKNERQSVAWALVGAPRPKMPCVLLITRKSPGNGMDDDNLGQACKAVRDQIAQWLGVNDKLREIVRYTYAQEMRVEWGVRVEVVS